MPTYISYTSVIAHLSLFYSALQELKEKVGCLFILSFNKNKNKTCLCRWMLSLVLTYERCLLSVAFMKKKEANLQTHEKETELQKCFWKCFEYKLHISLRTWRQWALKACLKEPFFIHNFCKEIRLRLASNLKIYVFLYLHSSIRLHCVMICSAQGTTLLLHKEVLEKCLPTGREFFSILRTDIYLLILSRCSSRQYFILK
jgi:ABC-type uncharacterized transport system permease subunit